MKTRAKVGAYLQDGLDQLKDKYECIGDVRGFGMMLGVEFVKENGEPDAELRDRIEMACFNRGLIILGCGTSTIRWSPPLILTKENVDVAPANLRRSNRGFDLKLERKHIACPRVRGFARTRGNAAH